VTTVLEASPAAPIVCAACAVTGTVIFLPRVDVSTEGTTKPGSHPQSELVGTPPASVWRAA
jgi:hypothetical protein